MSAGGDNSRIRITVNGATTVTAGLEREGILNFKLSFTHRDLKGATPEILSSLGHTAESWRDGTFTMSLGALDATNQLDVEWLRENLSVGDEVLVKVLPPGEIDVPSNQKATKVPPNRLQRALVAHTESKTSQPAVATNEQDSQQANSRKPVWIQHPEEPECCGRRMEFVGQLNDQQICTEQPKGAKLWWHDVASFYVFTCSQCLECKAVGQQY